MRKNENFSSENGAIVIEATISLTAFMFCIVTVLSIINVAYARSKIGVAINTTAKEISGYTYLYGVTGLNEKQADMYRQSEEARTKINDTINNFSNISNALGSISDTPETANLNPSSYQGTVDSIRNNVTV